MENLPTPPNSSNAVSSVRTGLVMVLVGFNSLGGTQAQVYLPLRLAGFILTAISTFAGICLLMYSTKYWLQYIHDYVDYRLAQQGTQPPSVT